MNLLVMATSVKFYIHVHGSSLLISLNNPCGLYIVPWHQNKLAEQELHVKVIEILLGQGQCSHCIKDGAKRRGFFH